AAMIVGVDTLRRILVEACDGFFQRCSVDAERGRQFGKGVVFGDERIVFRRAIGDGVATGIGCVGDEVGRDVFVGMRAVVIVIEGTGRRVVRAGFVEETFAARFDDNRALFV